MSHVDVSEICQQGRIGRTILPMCLRKIMPRDGLAIDRFRSGAFTRCGAVVRELSALCHGRGLPGRLSFWSWGLPPPPPHPHAVSIKYPIK